MCLAQNLSSQSVNLKLKPIHFNEYRTETIHELFALTIHGSHEHGLNKLCLLPVLLYPLGTVRLRRSNIHLGFNTIKIMLK